MTCDVLSCSLLLWAGLSLAGVVTYFEIFLVRRGGGGGGGRRGMRGQRRLPAF